eukprot:182041-Prorocentrum_minimum.AAC.2
MSGQMLGISSMGLRLRSGRGSKNTCRQPIGRAQGRESRRESRPAWRPTRSTFDRFRAQSCASVPRYIQFYFILYSRQRAGMLASIRILGPSQDLYPNDC